MSTNVRQPAEIYSTLGADPELSEIVELFVEEIPCRIEQLWHEFRHANWEALMRVAHQMKGAAGSYGFNELSPFAARLEESLRRGVALPEIAHCLGELVEVCQRVRSGVPRPSMY